MARLAAAAVAVGAGAGETGDALQETPNLVSRVGEGYSISSCGG